MLGYLSYNPEEDRRDQDERAAEIAWGQAQYVATELADRYVRERRGDTLAAIVSWHFNHVWRSKPDAFEELVKDATRLELESRLNAAELAAWHVLSENSDEYTHTMEAVRAKHERHAMTTTDLLRNAA